MFDSLRKKHPSFKDKLIAVTGNILENNLHLSNDNFHKIKDNINVVFHLAGTVKFDENLRYVLSQLFVFVLILLCYLFVCNC